MGKLTFEQLPEAVSLLLEKVNRIETLLNNIKFDGDINTAIGDELLTAKQTSEFLDISMSNLYKKTMNREIPHYSNGKKLYFKKEEVLSWVFSNRVKTHEEIQRDAMAYIAKQANKRLK